MRAFVIETFVIETWSSRGAEDKLSGKMPVWRMPGWRMSGWRMSGWPGRTTIARTVRLAGALGFVLGSIVWASHLLRRGPAVAMPPASLPGLSAPNPLAWREIGKPTRLYRLDASEFAAGPVTYTARHHDAGGGREDVLSLGAFDRATPALRLRIFRRADEPPSPTPLFAAIAHEAAQAALSVEHSTLPEILPTRFGRFEIADVALRGDAGLGERTCSGFRLMRDEPALSITGLACGAAAPLPRPALSCLIDRLDLGDVRDDAQLADFFARTAANRDPSCTDAQSGAEPSALEIAETEGATGKPATSRKSLRRRHDF